jgi:hypothetical protein
LHAVSEVSPRALDYLSRCHKQLAAVYELPEYGFEDEDAIETMRELDPGSALESIPVASHQKIAALRRKHIREAE